MNKKIEHKYIPAKTPPRYRVGEKIASGEVGGRVHACFWLNDQWNYTIDGPIGRDRDIPAGERAGTLRLGTAYVSENNVKWVEYDGCGWATPLKLGEVHTCH